MLNVHKMAGYSRKKIAAGNWKMNLDLDSAVALAKAVADGFVSSDSNTGVEIILAVPAPFLQATKQAFGSAPNVHIAAQNMHTAERGALTGEISGSMLTSVGASHVLVGHSERRQLFGETNASCLEKCAAALRHGLVPIYCFGETLSERESNSTFDVVSEQINQGAIALGRERFSQIILAYEPVWAIGTGKTASPEQAQEVHSFVRGLIHDHFDEQIAMECTILYGGSVNASNAYLLFACPDIDGGLVGGASLNAQDFLEIANSFL